MMPFADFVTTYWNKKRKSGVLWTPETAQEDCGEDLSTYFSYCQSKGGITDTQLIALSPVITATPFGIVIHDGTTTGDPLDRKVSDVTLRELVAAIRG